MCNISHKGPRKASLFGHDMRLMGKEYSIRRHIESSNSTISLGLRNLRIAVYFRKPPERLGYGDSEYRL
jgi:hypothetical protein